jgi:cyclopropane-fatty-acyl-phospholipid synthase
VTARTPISEWVLDRGLLPDPVLRWGIRRLIRARWRSEQRRNELDPGLQDAFATGLRAWPVAIETASANRQHYEVPARFFDLVLGPHRKYSCCYWPHTVDTLEHAEAVMFSLTCERAGLSDGQSILELGCGWGSLSCWMAEKYPHSRIVAVSNSSLQREFIETEAAARGLRNLQVITSDMNDFEPPGKFDRVVSIEMFEHMRNYPELLRRISRWLIPNGLLFIHIFCHRLWAYPFETEDSTGWMAKHFFTGGIMPSESLLPRFQDDLSLVGQWRIDGTHYQKTCEAWLARLDERRDAVVSLFEHTYGQGQGTRHTERWRAFFMACAELFSYRAGKEWFVAHYLFFKP